MAAITAAYRHSQTRVTALPESPASCSSKSGTSWSALPSRSMLEPVPGRSASSGAAAPRLVGGRRREQCRLGRFGRVTRRHRRDRGGGFGSAPPSPARLIAAGGHGEPGRRSCADASARARPFETVAVAVGGSRSVARRTISSNWAGTPSTTSPGRARHRSTGHRLGRAVCRRGTGCARSTART